MAKKLKLGPKASLEFRSANKHKRQELHVQRKRAIDSKKRDERFTRRREEGKNPALREARLAQNIPLTLDRKRTWDEIDRDTGDGFGLSVDVERLQKQQKLMQDETACENAPDAASDRESDDRDSMMDSSSSSGDEIETAKKASASETSKLARSRRTPTERATSPMPSTTSTNLELTPDSIVHRFPSLFSADLPPTPKILVTTSLSSTLHYEANLLTALFPNSNYVPRSSHRHGHKFSIREISSFASNRGYTSVIVLKEDQKKPTGLTIVHLPSGPTFHFSISNWMEGKKLPGHGRSTGHIPELILNNFRTPLGLLTAHLFRTLFPRQPQFQGRQVVTLHNQRDYIFFRQHRYIFREKRATERSVVGPDGKEVKGVEGIRAGLQELGPRFTLKLRRVDKSIQGKNGQEWVWKGSMEKRRTTFQL